VHAEQAAPREAADAKAIAAGERVVRERFGVDPDTCTGDHSCIRLSGCPSLTIKPNPDPLRREPVATVIDSCVGCGLCGEVAHAAVLCPSFYQGAIINNPTAAGTVLRARVRACGDRRAAAPASSGGWRQRPRSEGRAFGRAARPTPSRSPSPILAMGGEGGGVLADWIVDLGEHNGGYLAQTTSVPGVAQRTGATIYYVELFPKAAGAGAAPRRCWR
jgi:NAD-dependent dihydropyrimidine dehydrogenase PreA subunit